MPSINLITVQLALFRIISVALLPAGLLVAPAVVKAMDASSDLDANFGLPWVAAYLFGIYYLATMASIVWKVKGWFRRLKEVGTEIREELAHRRR